VWCVVCVCVFSIPALLATVEGRLDEVRTAVLAEVTALKSRPGTIFMCVCTCVTETHRQFVCVCV